MCWGGHAEKGQKVLGQLTQALFGRDVALCATAEHLLTANPLTGRFALVTGARDCPTRGLLHERLYECRASAHSAHTPCSSSHCYSMCSTILCDLSQHAADGNYFQCKEVAGSHCDLCLTLCQSSRFVWLPSQQCIHENDGVPCCSTRGNPVPATAGHWSHYFFQTMDVVWRNQCHFLQSQKWAGVCIVGRR